MTDLIERYGLVQVPRYTSYPTAPHFHAGIDGSAYRRWLEEIAPDEPLSLYLHVPFCREMCWYCGCHTKVSRRYEPVARYADALHREIDLVADTLARRQSVQHVHWGGGSPNRLRREDFLALMRRLHDRFAIDEGAEIAVEIDPRGFDPEDARAYAEAGVNRVSLGVQTFDDTVQRAINRVQPFAMVEGVVDVLRRSGITAINVDLMYGLPQQTTDSVLRTAEQAVQLDPDRLAVFGYAHVPWMKTHMRLIDEADLPGVKARFAQSEAIRRELVDRGYRAVGLDHFARSGDSLATAADSGSLARNFQGYTADPVSTLIGLGASSIGSLDQGYVQNAPDIGTYMRAVTTGTLATARGIALDEEDRLRRSLIEDVMCRGRVDLGAAADGREAARVDLTEAWARIHPLLEDGIVWRDGDTVGVTGEGRPFVRSLAACLDAYLGQGKARHSKAV